MIPTAESNLVQGMINLAKAIEAEFKIPCNRQTIHYWKKLPPPKNFPPANEGNCYDWDVVCRWMDNHLAEQGKGDGSPNQLLLDQKAFEAKSRTTIRKDKWDEMDFKKAQGLLIDRVKADITTKTALRLYHGFVRTELERNLTDRRREKLVALGVTPEQVAAFFEFDIELARSIVDLIETKCEEESK